MLRASDPETVDQIGIETSGVAVLTALPTLEFGPAWGRSVVTTYEGIEIRVLGLGPEGARLTRSAASSPVGARSHGSPV
jgi:hypothetical protein